MLSVKWADEALASSAEGVLDAVNFWLGDERR